MSYQLKVKSQEAGPWGVGASRYVTFRIDGGKSAWEIANSYIEFQGTVTMDEVTYLSPGPGVAGIYTGQLTYGYIDAADSYPYYSGPSVFVKHAWMESTNLGKVESKRYANRINEHLASLQKSTFQVFSQNYSGGIKQQITDNQFVCRLQLSDLFELPKDNPLVDLGYMGDVVITLELEVVNENAVFLKYDNDTLPVDPIACNDQVAPAAGVTVLTIPGRQREETGLHFNQIYRVLWDNGVDPQNDTQHKIADFTQVGADLEITIFPALGNDGVENVENIEIGSLDITALTSGVDALVLNTVDLVMYKPFGDVNMPNITFREMLVDTDVFPAVTDYHKQFTVEPNVEKCILMTPKDNQFANLQQDLQLYRNQINGYDTVDRDVLKNSGLYYDRILMNMPTAKTLLFQNTRYHLSEKMPMNGLSNSLNVNMQFTNATEAGTSYLFKQQVKTL
jgi:hypothetical protein